MADVATLSVLLIARDKLSGALARNQKALRATGVAATAMGAALTGIAALSVKAAIDFESSFAGVRKTVDATEAQFAELASGFRNLAKEIPVNVNELNRIGEAAGQLGIKRENIIAFTETIAKLGVTTNLTGEQAATQLARIANITGLSQKEFDKLGSAIVELGNNLATTEAEIVTFSLRIAGASTIAGISETQMLAIGGAMTSVGIQAEAGGTAVQKALLKINQAVVESNADLNVLARTAGVTSEQFAQAWRDDAGGAFTLFVEGLGKAGDDAVNILAEVDLTDQRLIRSFLSLANAGGLLRDSMKLSNDAFQANTALTKEAEERFKTFASQISIAKNQLVDVAITIGQALIPVLQSILDKVLPIVEIVGRWMSENQQLATVLVITAAAVGGLLLVLGPLLIMLPGLVAAVGLASGAMVAATTAVVGFRIALAALGTASAGPIGLVIAGVGILAAAFVPKLLGRIGDTKVALNEFADTAEQTAERLSSLGRGAILRQMDLLNKQIIEVTRELDAAKVDSFADAFKSMFRLTKSAVPQLETDLNRLQDVLRTLAMRIDEDSQAMREFGAVSEEQLELITNRAGGTAKALQERFTESFEDTKARFLELGLISEETFADIVAKNQESLDARALMNDNFIAGQIALAQGSADAQLQIEKDAAAERLAVAARSLNDLVALANAHNQRLRNAALTAAAGVTDFAQAGNVPVNIGASIGNLPLAALQARTGINTAATLGGQQVNIQPGLTPPGPTGGAQLRTVNVTMNMNAPSFEAETTIAQAVRNVAESGGFDDLFENED